MELEFEGLYDQQFDSDMFLDSNGSQDLWDFFTYPVMLWDLPNNINEGLNLGNFSLDGALEHVSAEEKALLLQQFSKSPSQRQQLEVQQSLQDSNYNSPTNSRVSALNTESLSCVEKNSTSEDGERHKLESCSSHPTQQKQKQKVCWTPELHALFVKAVEHLGIYNAVPTKILELMGVRGLTRHNIASHLQKYRATVKRLRGKEELGLGEGTRRRKPRRQHLMCSLLNKTHHVLKQQQLSPAATTGGMLPVAGEGIYAHFTQRLQFWGPSAHVFSRQQFNHFGGHQWPLQQPSGYRPILPAATAAYEQSFVRYPTVGLHHSAAEHEEALCSVDSEAHIDSTAMYHPEKSAVVEAVNEVLSNPCSHSPIGLIPPSLDTLTTTTAADEGG